MPQDNINLIREAYEKFARRDIPAIFMLFDDEIQIYQTELVPWGGIYRGHSGARVFFAKLLEHLDTQIEVDEYVNAGDHVAVIAHTRGTVKSNGNRFNIRAIHLWTFRDEKAIRIEYYIDTPQMLKALEM